MTAEVQDAACAEMPADARARDTEQEMTDEEWFSRLVSVMGTNPVSPVRDRRAAQGVPMSAMFQVYRGSVIGGHAQVGVPSGGGSRAVTPPGGYAEVIKIGGPGWMGIGRNLYSSRRRPSWN